MLLNRNYPEVKGSVFYNYTSISKYPALMAVIKAVYSKLDGNTGGNTGNNPGGNNRQHACPQLHGLPAISRRAIQRIT
jgi:hypothetical protein